MVGATEHDRQTIAAWVFCKIFVGHGHVLLYLRLVCGVIRTDL